ncbi:MAG: PA14 domain-containing protein [Litorilinea sp.]
MKTGLSRGDDAWTRRVLRGARARLAHGNVWLALGAVGIAVAAQWQLTAGAIAGAAILYIVAGLVYAASGALTQPLAGACAVPRSPAEFAPSPAPTPGLRRIWFLTPDQLYLIVLALALGMAAHSWRLFDFYTGSHAAWRWYGWAVLLLFLAAAVESAVGSFGYLRGTRSGFSRAGWGQGAIFVLLLGLAAGLRIFQLDTLPFGTWYDEAANGLEALRVVNEPDFRPVYNAGVNASGHYLFLIVRFFDYFGVETHSIRLISALMGVGLVGAAFWLGKTLLGLPGGILFALLLAVARWSINFSRVGMYNISTPLLAVLALLFLLWGLRRGRLRDYGLAGLAAGFGLTFYSAYYLFLPVLGLVAGAGLIRQRAAWRSVALGIGVMALAGAVVFAPTAKFALERSETYLGRVQTTSLWARTAPDARMAALAQNAAKHLRMFHVQGDPNGRHNLPGRPMLDPIAGALMLLGLVMCLARPRRLYAWLLPVWLGTALLGGILSLDFESPQSLRSIGALPPAYLLATLPLTAILQLARRHASGTESGGWSTGRLPRVVAGLGVATLVIGVAWIDIRTYFVVQARDFSAWNAFSTPETLAAQMLASTPGIAEGIVHPYIISLYDGHPTLRFLAGTDQPYTRLETTDTLPLAVPPDRDILLIVDADRRYFFEEAQALYPNAEFRAQQPPFGGPTVLYSAHISVADQAAIQGARATYYAGATWDAVTKTEADAPIGAGDTHMGLSRLGVAGMLDPPAVFRNPLAPAGGQFWVEWETTLLATSYGAHAFHVRGPGRVELYIGDELAAYHNPDSQETEAGANPQRAIVLAQGAHRLRIRAESGAWQAGDVTAAHAIQLAWRPPDRDWETLPAWLTYHTPLQPQGLLGRYYANGEWAGLEAFSRIDGRWDMYFHVLPLPRPFTVEWTGMLHIPETGEYGLGVHATDAATLWLDGAAIAQHSGGGTSSSGRRLLQRGAYPIRIRYADRTHHTSFRLLWEPPGSGGLRTIPNGFLSPPDSGYEMVAAEFFAGLPPADGEPGPGATAMSQIVPQSAVEHAQVEVVVDGLAQPTGVALTPGMVWVAEPDAARVQGFTRGGEAQVSLQRGLTGAMEDPTALAVVDPHTSYARLLVLDAATGVIHRFGLDGTPFAPWPVAPDLAQRSRGLYVDDAGALWLVATARGELARVDPAGNVLQIVPLRTGGELWQGVQPVSMLRWADGTLFVADAGLNKLIAFDNAGRRRFAWDIPRANTIAGPHLAAGAGEVFYRSVPEEGQIIVHAPGDADAGVQVWNLRGATLPAVRPVGLAVDESGILWITDTHGGQLLKTVLASTLSATSGDPSAPDDPGDAAQQILSD